MLDEAAGETDHRFPVVLPGGSAVLFTVWSSQLVNSGIETAEIVAQVVSTGERRKIIAGAAARYATSRTLIFSRPDGLWAVGFSPDRLETIGAPMRVLEGVRIFGAGETQLALSANGTLVYASGGSGPSPARTLVWADRNGGEQPLRAPPRAYEYARLSPDGLRIALDIRDQQNDIWVWNIARETPTRLTFDPVLDRGPA